MIMMQVFVHNHDNSDNDDDEEDDDNTKRLKAPPLNHTPIPDKPFSADRRCPLQRSVLPVCIFMSGFDQKFKKIVD